MLWASVLCSMVAGSKKPAGGGGGFGAAPKAPPTLREVARTFKSRLPKDTSVLCACGNGAPYAECCRPYHKGDAAAETPERLLRTRYSGFAYRLIPYIIETTDTTRACRRLTLTLTPTLPLTLTTDPTSDPNH
mgnify:CR=1|tara:strand:- start:190 stop:588 length:399 start_codon:yes stop_codon:yes gene_type:complete